MEDIFTQIWRELKRIERRITIPEAPRWVDWSPTVDQGGAVSATVDYARVFFNNGRVDIIADITIDGSGTAANNIQIGGLPYLIAHTAGRVAMGSCIIRNTGTACYSGVVDNISDEIIIFRLGGSSGHTASDGIGADPSFALAANDTISFQAIYEALY